MPRSPPWAAGLVPDSFGEVEGSDVVAAGKVGNGACGGRGGRLWHSGRDARSAHYRGRRPVSGMYTFWRSWSIQLANAVASSPSWPSNANVRTLPGVLRYGGGA